jgi:hypothetical protein
MRRVRPILISMGITLAFAVAFRLWPEKFVQYGMWAGM